MTARRFGPYLLQHVLSDGPTGRVFRAQDTSHGDRLVALKVFARQLSADPSFRERFRRDAGILSGLNEPHLVPIHRYGDHDGLLYLDMRLVRGTDLATALRTGALDAGRARAIAEQLASVTEALRCSRLGARPLERSDVLLTGGAGRGEFVQVVGLGLGRPPLGPAPSPIALVGLPELGPRPRAAAQPALRRGRARLVIAALVGAALVAAAVVLLGGRDTGPRAPGLVATIPGQGGVRFAATAVLDGRSVLATTTLDGSVRTWDLATGRAGAAPIPGDAGSVTTAVLAGRPVALIRERDESLHLFDLADGRPLATTAGPPPPVGSPRWPYFPLTTGTVDDAAVVVVPVRAGTVPKVGLQVLRLPGFEPVGGLIATDGADLVDPVVATVGGTPAVLAREEGTAVRAFALATAEPLGVVAAPQSGSLTAFTAADVGGTPMVVTGGQDNTIRRWDLRTGEQVGPPLSGHARAVRQLAVVRIRDRPVLVSGSAADATGRMEVRFWDLTTGTPTGSTLVGHPLGNGLVAVGQIGGRAVLVAAGEDVTVWDAASLVEEGGHR